MEENDISQVASVTPWWPWHGRTSEAYMRKNRCRHVGLLAAWLAVLITSTASAQSAMVRGTILDAVTSEPLPWANVIIVGTSIGGASDIEGKFAIRNVPVGSYTIRATYIGYETRELEVVLTVDQVLELELLLESGEPYRRRNHCYGTGKWPNGGDKSATVVVGDYECCIWCTNTGGSPMQMQLNQ